MRYELLPAGMGATQKRISLPIMILHHFSKSSDSFSASAKVIRRTGDVVRPCGAGEDASDSV